MERARLGQPPERCLDELVARAQVVEHIDALRDVERLEALRHEDAAPLDEARGVAR